MSSSSPVKISAARDVETGEVYVPPRRLSADGGMRECTNFELIGSGVLRAWTVLAGEHYGLVELDEGLRIQVRLEPGQHAYGERYVAVPGEETRFTHA